MLFSSFEFIFVFLPLTLAAYLFLRARGLSSASQLWLVVASLFFYGWWNPVYLGLIIPSLVVNFAIGWALSRHYPKVRTNDGPANPEQRFDRRLLIAGIVFNLALLGYFKYAAFVVDNVAALAGTDWVVGNIALPLAISFFTFQKIAYLMDAYRGQAPRYGFLQYCLFVLFFPQLIAGPIVHHSEVIPQFLKTRRRWLNLTDLSVGLTIFAIGLFKKTCLADTMAPVANQVFAAADGGGVISLIDAWTGALAYTFQLYFDFSGYTDMAIGAARLFGIRLPLNFNSPYKATSIIDFWRRWHMTLSRFLRDYVYFSLGGSRKGPLRRYLNLMATMLLGGLWHGAGWTFVLWGALHGFYLLVNHLWRSTVGTRLPRAWQASAASQWLGRILTFLAVVVGWVLFRAETLAGAQHILAGMIGLHGCIVPERYLAVLPNVAATLHLFGIESGKLLVDVKDIGWLPVLLTVAWFLPNTQELMARYRPAFERFAGGPPWSRQRLLAWRPTPIWGCYAATLFAFGVVGILGANQFLYFNF